MLVTYNLERNGEVLSPGAIPRNSLKSPSPSCSVFRQFIKRVINYNRFHKKPFCETMIVKSTASASLTKTTV